VHALDHAEERDEDMAVATAAAAAGGAVGSVAAAAAAATAAAVASASRNMFDVLADDAEGGSGQWRVAAAVPAPSFVLQAASFSLQPPPPLTDLDEATGEADGTAGAACAGEEEDDGEDEPDL